MTTANIIKILSTGTIAVAVALSATQYAWAQEEIAPVGPQGNNPPPSIETNSPGGVDMTTGAYSMQSVDLQIGEGSFPDGLTLVRSYNSAVDEIFSGFGARGWSENWRMQVTQSVIPRDYYQTGLDDPECQGSLNPTICNVLTTEFFTVVAFGNGSAKFSNGRTGNETGRNIPGIYMALEAHNLSQKLEFIATPGSNNQHADGHYEFTDTDGTLYKFNSFANGNGLSQIIAPNGTIANLSQFSKRRVVTNRGYALIFEADAPNGRLGSACVINLATNYVGLNDGCPAGGLSTQYSYDIISAYYPAVSYQEERTRQFWQLTSATNALGETTSYLYDDGQHLECIKDPMQNVCRIRMKYSTCTYDDDLNSANPLPLELPEIHLSERVIEQKIATGETYDYYFSRLLVNSAKCPGPPDLGGLNGYKDSQGNNTEFDMLNNRPIKITDSLNRVISQNYWKPNFLPEIPGVTGAGLIASQTFPEGDRIEVDYNDRGLVTEQRFIPKSGSGEPTLVTTTIYPADCTPTTRKTCNKPVRSTDASGNVTDYEYAAEHGGVTRVLGPVVGGVRPETRYVYGQKYAWLKTAGGGYARGDSPIWLLLEERSCTNSAMNAAGNCGNADDLVVTRYQYQEGSTSKGSNLWLLGTAVSATNANGQSETLRTCYGYDEYGRKVSETQPKGTGSTCS